MAAKARDVSPFLQVLRNVLLGRTHRTPLRFEDQIAPRTQPPPKLPDGPHHKLSVNYYYTRDGRRENKPPLLIQDIGKSKAITAGETKSVTTKELKRPVPGNPFEWTKSPQSPY
ncbi:hypothetical protein CHUAL_011623 [Chamberlinius hualienensis]